MSTFGTRRRMRSRIVSPSRSVRRAGTGGGVGYRPSSPISGPRCAGIVLVLCSAAAVEREGGGGNDGDGAGIDTADCEAVASGSADGFSVALEFAPGPVFELLRGLRPTEPFRPTDGFLAAPER